MSCLWGHSLTRHKPKTPHSIYQNKFQKVKFHSVLDHFSLWSMVTKELAECRHFCMSILCTSCWFDMYKIPGSCYWLVLHYVHGQLKWLTSSSQFLIQQLDPSQANRLCHIECVNFCETMLLAISTWRKSPPSHLFFFFPLSTCILCSFTVSNILIGIKNKRKSFSMLLAYWHVQWWLFRPSPCILLLILLVIIQAWEGGWDEVYSVLVTFSSSMKETIHLRGWAFGHLLIIS